jgi:hypothetical protein
VEGWEKIVGDVTECGGEKAVWIYNPPDLSPG